MGLGQPLPPTIVHQPTDQAVAQGSIARFIVGATGTAPLSYQWRQDGVDVLQATNFSFTVGSSQLTNAGDYTVVVTNLAGSVTSRVALLSVAIGRVYTNAERTQLPYRLFLPRNYDPAQKYPLVLFWHGAGESGNDNLAQLTDYGQFVFLSASNQIKHPCFFLAPQLPGFGLGFGCEFEDQTVELLQLLEGEFNIDSDRIYVTGLSMGGFMSWDFIAGYPDVFAAAVPMAGGWGIGCASYDSFLGIRVPVWNFHAADDGVNPVDLSDFAVSSLRNAGANPIYTRYHFGGHGIWPKAYGTPVLVDWIMAQRRGVASTIPPLVTITNPTAPATFTFSSALDLAGTASLNLASVLQVTWTNTFNGAGGVATGTNLWSANSIPLELLSTNLIVVTARGTSYSSSLGGDTTFNDTLAVLRTVNHAPSFTKGPDQIVAADFGPQTVEHWATDISAGSGLESGQVLTFLVTNDSPALFAVQPAISPTGTLTYAPAPDQAGAATVTVWLKDDGGTAYGGQDTSAPQTFQIKVTPLNQPPVVVEQPISRTNINGTRATFSVAVDGTVPFSYRWRKDGLDLTEGGNVFGVATPTLSLSNVLGGDAGGYSVVITNAYGSVTSLVATLSVIDPVIIGQPVGQPKIWGQSVTFSVTAVGTLPLGYQWRKGGTALVQATSSSLTLANLKGSDAGNYSVVVSNRYGSLASVVATLVVFDPAIIRQPFDQYQTAGQSVTFSVPAVGSPPLSYQWEKDGIALALATATSLVLTNLQAADAGSYTVIVSNQYGSMTSGAAHLDIRTWVPRFADDFDSDTSGLWEVNRSSSDTRASFNYDYSTNGIPSAPNSAGASTRGLKLEANMTAGVPAALSLSPLGLALLTGEYRLRFDLWINANGPFPGGGVGATKHFTAGVGTDGTRVQWLRPGSTADGLWFAADGEGGSPDTSTTALPDFAAVSGRTLQSAASGVYAAGTASNAFGNGNPYYASTFPDGHTAPAWQESNYPQQTGGLAVGTLGFVWRDVVITKMLTSTGYTVAWSIDGLPIATFSRASTTGDNIFVGYYDSYASVSDNAALSFALVDNLRVELGGAVPRLTAQPQDQKISLFGTATLSVEAAYLNSGPPSYQWQFNGVAMSGATNSDLVITNAQESDQGLYSVVVSNLFGSVTSHSARLLVNQPPVADASASRMLYISPNGATATVILDGTRSSDPDGDLLQWAWYEGGNPNPLAGGAVAVVVLPLGAHTLQLVVNDGMLAATNVLIVEVITAAQAVGRLIAQVEAADERTKPLNASLRAALESLAEGHLGPAINQLQAFQNKVRAQVAGSDPALAATFLHAAQEIIDALSSGESSSSGKSHGHITFLKHGGGKARVEISAEPGRTYIVEASTNLVDWEMIGLAADRGDGTFTMEDPNVSRFPSRFYRIVSP